MKLEHVPARRRREAMRFLVGGGSDDPLARARAQTFEELIRFRGEERVRLWWAREGRRCLAAALVFESPGRTGMVSYSPLSVPGVDGAALSAVVGAISRDALDRGLSLVQALLKTDAQGDVAMLLAAGYQQLAELVYMRRDLEELPPAGGDAAWSWRRYEQFSDAELAAVIEATYEGSLDCPSLRGRRDVGDILEGHKATGIFRPESWWLVERDGEPAGCILVNDSAAQSAFEVVYLGVVPAFRRRGLARAMLRRAMVDGRGEGRAALRLAVDARNDYAVDLYRREGFRVTNRRQTYVMLAGCG